jgi:hypothetical protein
MPGWFLERANGHRQPPMAIRGNLFPPVTPRGHPRPPRPPATCTPWEHLCPLEATHNPLRWAVIPQGHPQPYEDTCNPLRQLATPQTTRDPLRPPTTPTGPHATLLGHPRHLEATHNQRPSLARPIYQSSKYQNDCLIKKRTFLVRYLDQCSKFQISAAFRLRPSLTQNPCQLKPFKAPVNSSWNKRHRSQNMIGF